MLLYLIYEQSLIYKNQCYTYTPLYCIYVMCNIHLLLYNIVLYGASYILTLQKFWSGKMWLQLQMINISCLPKMLGLHIHGGFISARLGGLNFHPGSLYVCNTNFTIICEILQTRLNLNPGWSIQAQYVLPWLEISARQGKLIILFLTGWKPPCDRPLTGGPCSVIVLLGLNNDTKSTAFHEETNTVTPLFDNIAVNCLRMRKK